LSEYSRALFVPMQNCRASSRLETVKRILAVALLVTLTAAAQAEPQAEPSGVVTERKAQPKKKGPRLRERETEGTEAADRFEADTVIKSKYQLNGEQLEVDPD
jgi:hypothetical protein